MEPPNESKGAGTASPVARAATAAARGTLRAVARLDALLDRRTEARALRDPRSVPRIVPYTGYASDAVATVFARVLRDPEPRVPSPADGTLRNLRATWARFETDEVPRARVRVSLGGRSVVVQADEEGYVHADIPLLRPLEPVRGVWTQARLTLEWPRAEAPSISSRAPLLLPSPEAAFGVISDLDDTVLRSDVTRKLRMALTLALRNAHTRLPFPGVAAFYRALAGGTHGPNPLFYVSSSPWNLYDMLSDFLRLQGIPHGPLLLRDWGLGGEQVSPLRHHSHKRGAIDGILERYPRLRFLLIGDSGQQDPEIYASVVRDHPGRVLAVYIRDVTRSATRQAAIAALASELRRTGGSLHLVPDTLTAARHAARCGWIDPARLPEVAAERRADRGA